MLKFECKMLSRIDAEIWVIKEDWSKCPNLSERGIPSKHWNLKTKLGINQNVEIWVLMVKLIKMLKFEWKGNNQWKCWNLSKKEEVQQMFMFYCISGNRSKLWNLKTNESSEYWNLRTKLGINQNVEIWVLIVNSIKMLIFEWKKVGNESKSWRFSAISWESIKMLEFDWKIRNRSGYWNWEQNWESIKMLKFEC